MKYEVYIDDVIMGQFPNEELANDFRCMCNLTWKVRKIQSTDRECMIAKLRENAESLMIDRLHGPTDQMKCSAIFYNSVANELELQS